MAEQHISKNHILYEDNHLIAIRKDPGVLVQGDQTGDKSLVDSVGDYLKKTYNKPGNVFTGLVHRLDRPVSGLVVFAKTSKALGRMNGIFRNRDVEKIYLAIVEGKVKQKSGEITSFLRKDAQKNKSFSSDSAQEGYKKAVLRYTVVQELNNFSLVRVVPDTGRHHQIRVQLASLGHPIKGDLKYGAKRSNEDASICLHAWHLSFVHPVKKEPVSIEANLPDTDLWKEVVTDQILIPSKQTSSS